MSTHNPDRRESGVGDDSVLLKSSTLRARRNIIVTRPIFSQDKFDNSQELGEYGTPTSPWGKLQRSVHRKISAAREWRPSLYRLVLGFLMGAFPILKWIPRYRVKQYLAKDCIAGFTVGIMNIPQGMAYSLLASMPAVFGLYTSFFPVLIYTLMATSKHVSVGVFAIVSIMTGKVVNRYALPTRSVAAASFLPAGSNASIPGLTDSIATEEMDVNSHLDARIRVVVALTMAVGIWQLLMGLLGLGYLTVYLSDQLVKGFTTGSAFHVFTSQLKSIFGLRKMIEYNGAFKLIYTYRDFFSMIKDTHIPTLIVSIVCTIFLLLVKYLFNDNAWIQRRLPMRLPIPGELLVVIFGTLASYLMALGPKYGVDIVGLIPLGMPVPQVPDLSILPAFALDSFAIAIVSFAITLSLSKLYATKYKYEMDSSQELRALGCSNIFGGFFQCIPSTGSLGRTAVQTSIGGETQIVSIISAAFVMVVLLAMGHLMEPLPKACLGCIIMVALIGMLKQVGVIRKLWKVSAIDTSVFFVSLLAVVLLDVDIGLGVAVGWSLLTVVFRTQRPDVSVLGRALHTDIYKRIDVYKSAAEVDGCKIIRFDAPLYFANAEYFQQRVRSISKLDHRGITLTRPPVPDKPAAKDVVVHDASRGSHDAQMEVIEMSRIVDVKRHALPQTSNKRVPSAEIVYHPSNSSTSPSTVDAATWTADFFEQPVKHVVLDCSSMCFVDINGIQAIKDLAAECSDMGISLYLASCKANMRESLALCGFSEELNVDHLFVTVHDAVMFVIRARRQAEKLREPSLPEEEETEDTFDMDFPGLSSFGDGRWSLKTATFGTQTSPMKAPPASASKF
ncbi:Pendrin [Hypsibius exemplaris]|uniref:Pendrin n=1 Tax=Hypsibius exemplaris TaxID=2072580 RepID=A0A1W0WPA0_HYPEX|nr:Pendrin [Hypsibius exemplaris]